MSFNTLTNLKPDFFISLDGPIASGKTKLGKSLVKERGTHECIFYPESGHEDHILEQWMTDKDERTSMFQTWMFAHCVVREEMAKQAKFMSTTNQWIIIDRSVDGNHAFEVNSFVHDKLITESQHQFYQLLFDVHHKKPYSGADLNVYLWVQPDVCYRRLCKRNKIAEIVGYNLDVFWNIEKCHFASILQNLTAYKPHPQVVVDWGDVFGTMDRFYTMMHDMLSSPVTSAQPSKITLVKNPNLFMDMMMDSHHQFSDSLLIPEGEDLMDHHNIILIMNKLATSGSLKTPKHLLLCVPTHTPDTLLDGNYRLYFTI